MYFSFMADAAAVCVLGTGTSDRRAELATHDPGAVANAGGDQVSALDSCCKCGGGCTDKAGWVDKASRGSISAVGGMHSTKMVLVSIDAVLYSDAPWHHYGIR